MFRRRQKERKDGKDTSTKAPPALSETPKPLIFAPELTRSVSRTSSAPERPASAAYPPPPLPQRSVSDGPKERPRNMSPAMQRELYRRAQKQNGSGSISSPLSSPISIPTTASAPAPTPIPTPTPTPTPTPSGDNSLRRKITSPAVTGYVPEELTSYSSPLRRRKALLIGISYRDNRYLEYLPGCKNDVQLMFELLTSRLFGFRQDSVKVLSDELLRIDQVDVEPATRVNIVRYLKWLTDDVKRGDSVVFFFAGHGECIEDESGDEIDTGYDQCIMPADYRPDPRHSTAATKLKGVPPVLDDIIYERLVRSVPGGAKVTAVVDACRSGTVCDLPVTYGPDRIPVFRNGETTPPRELMQLHKSAGGCVLFSGSADHQRALDITLPRNGVLESFGIMTRSFVDAVREMAVERDPRCYMGVEGWTYGRLYERVRELVHERCKRVLPEGFEVQEPQLSTSHEIKAWETAFTM